MIIVRERIKIGKRLMTDVIINRRCSEITTLSNDIYQVTSHTPQLNSRKEKGNEIKSKQNHKEGQKKKKEK
jgi:hypothetical protein